MADDLTKPLGLDKPKAAHAGRRFAGMAAAGAAVLVATIGVSTFLIEDPGSWRGQPAATAALDRSGLSGNDAAATTASIRKPATDADTGEATLTDLIPDGSIAEVGAAPADADRFDPMPMRLASAPIDGLTEAGAYGLLPKVGPDGARPLDRYARPMTQAAAGRPRLAIIVTGIGDAESASDMALRRLPGAVTLAFAPHGGDLPMLLNRARETGHEVLLQIPLEPYGYPGNDPGPHTLTVDAGADVNRDNLHWLMSRITNYVGAINQLGARFSGESDAMEPVLAEIGARGLLYVDDGTVRGSKAAALAPGRVPFASADVVLDAVTEAPAIDERLAYAADLAAKQGQAIAIATAFPISIERIVEFARSSEARGIEIVPITAIAGSKRI